MRVNFCIGYIDPGSGAMVLQGLLAVIVGAGFFLRRKVGGIFRRLTGRGGDKKDASGDNQPKEPAHPDKP